MREVGRQVIYQQGCYTRVRIWYAGHITGIGGMLTLGFRGEQQTVVVRDLIEPQGIIEVALRKVA